MTKYNALKYLSQEKSELNEIIKTLKNENKRCCKKLKKALKSQVKTYQYIMEYLA